MADIEPPQVAPEQEDVHGIPDEVHAPPVPPRAPHAQQAPLQFLRSPPMLRQENDLDIYLRRFQSYVDSIGARPEEIAHVLVNCCADEVLLNIERFLVPDITYEQLIAVLRREFDGTNENREVYKAKLRKTLRGRNENIRAFYVKLFKLAKRAYPHDEAFRDVALRDAFVNNLQDSQISARLREQADMNNEQLLEHAAMLVNCKTASLSRQPEPVNAAFDSSDSDPGIKLQQRMSEQLEQMVELMANNIIANKSPTPDETNPASGQAANHPNRDGHQGDMNVTYQYQCPRCSIGLPGYQGNTGYRNEGNYRYPNNYFPDNRPNYWNNNRAIYRNNNFQNNRNNAWFDNRTPYYNSEINFRIPALPASRQPHDRFSQPDTFNPTEQQCRDSDNNIVNH